MTPTDLPKGTSDVAANTPPRILVVDDRPDHVEVLIHQLRQAGLDVITAASKEEAIKTLGENTIDIALIDVNLREAEPRDRDGLFLAGQVTTLAPEARVIFISRPAFLDVRTLLQMFNRDPDLVNGRLAEAYVDKANTGAVVRMCNLVLGAKHGEEWRVPLVATIETWDAVKYDLNHKVGSVMKTRGSDLIDGERQCLQILRRLASDDLMPLKEVRIDRVSHGRSRTVVLMMTAKYNPTDAQRSTVVKIGDRGIVRAERDNYVKWVPSFVKFAAYPSMTGAATSRQLAGIGYSMLGDPNEPAQTFVDRFWDMQEEKSLKTLDDVFHSLLVPSEVPKYVRSNTIRNEYGTRFQQLDTNLFADDLARFCKNCGIRATDRSWEIPVGKEIRIVDRPTDAVDNVFFNPYWVSVVHGDLHGENIIVSKDDRTFLIDFAHIGERHVFLDYVVMEMSVRMHLLRRLLMQVPAASIQDYITSWVQIEEWLALDENDRGDKPPFDAHTGMERLSRLARLVLWLRKNAWLHGFNDTYHNYYGALGMACLTSPYLPDESTDKVKYGIRRALLSCAAFSVAKACIETRMRPLDDAMATRDSQDAFLTSLLTASRFRIGQIAKAQLQAFFRELTAPLLQTAADSGLPIRRLLQDEMPSFSNALSQDGALDALQCTLTPTARNTMTDLVVAINVLASVEHVSVQALKDRLSQWSHEAWSRRDAKG